MSGWWCLFVLSLLVLVSALALASRGWRENTAELLLATLVFCFAFITIPTHTLGWLEQLDRFRLALATLGTCVFALTIAWGSSNPIQEIKRTGHSAQAIARFIARAFRSSWREHSITFLGLLATTAILLWTAWISYLAPSDGWDGLVYHEPMIGFGLQNHGFSWTPVPLAAALINAFPRFAESFSLWIVAFSDRSLIELAPTLLSPMLIVGFYVIARRFIASSVIAAGLACALFTTAGFVLQLRSNYVDTIFAAIFVAALHFMTRPHLRKRDILVACLCLGLVGGSKVTGLVLTPLLLGILALRILRLIWKQRSGFPGCTFFLGAVLALSLMGPTYLRNWHKHKNPLWPAKVSIKALHIELPGPWTIADQNIPTREFVRQLFAPPQANSQFCDTRDNGYGNGAPFVILPLAIVGLLTACFQVLFCKQRRKQAGHLLFVAVPTALTYIISPAQYWARLNLHVVIAIWLLAAWVIGSSKRRFLAEAITGALIVTNLMTLWWSEPGWNVSWNRYKYLLNRAPMERTALPDASPTLMPELTTLARERELHAGNILIFADHPFPGVLWNEHFSNRVIWLDPAEHSNEEWIKKAESLQPTWIVLPLYTMLPARLQQTGRWEEVGPASPDKTVTAYRRKPPLGPAKTPHLTLQNNSLNSPPLLEKPHARPHQAQLRNLQPGQLRLLEKQAHDAGQVQNQKVLPRLSKPPSP